MSYENMDPISRQDKDREAEAAQYAAERLSDYTAARFCCGTCDQCGGHDGMRAYDRVAVNWFIWGNAPPTFYQLRADLHHLFACCDPCNPGKVVPDGYELMSREQVRDWLATPCDCTACMMDRGEI